MAWIRVDATWRACTWVWETGRLRPRTCMRRPFQNAEIVRCFITELCNPDPSGVARRRGDEIARFFEILGNRWKAPRRPGINSSSQVGLEFLMQSIIFMQSISGATKREETCKMVLPTMDSAAAET